MIRRVVAAIALIGLSVSARAESAVQVALDLGVVIGSEEGCGLSYDQAAIENFVASKVPADDMEFMGTMNSSANVTERKVERFSASQKTAHCAQVRRVAKANGFVK